MIMKKGKLHLGLILLSSLFAITDATAQSSTINTEQMATSGYSSNTSAGSGGTAYITFAIENNSGGDIKLTDVGRYVTSTYNGETSTLYYSETELSGNPGTLPTTGWTEVDENILSGISTSDINPVNVGMEFIIPDGKTYRFALMITGTNYYSSSGSPNTFTVNGVSLYCGDYQINGANVGYGASNTPRYFRGFITFEPACDAKITQQPANQNACLNGEVTLTATTTDAQTFRWQVNNNGNWTNINDNATYSGATTNTLQINNVTTAITANKYRLVGTNTASGCSVISEAASINLLGSGFSTIGIFSSTGETICRGQEVSVHAYFTNGGTNPQFVWYRNGTVIPGETAGVLKISTLNNGDVVTSRLFSNAQCVSPSLSDGIRFDVDAIQKPAVRISSVYNEDNSTTFTATASGGGVNPRYYWMINKNVIPGEDGATFTTSLLNPGDQVSVSMRSDLPCADPPVVASNSLTGVENLSGNATASFSILPNPNNGSFMIRGLGDSKTAGEQIVVRITNAMGQVVHQQSIATSTTELPVNMPDNVPNGMYIVNIVADGQVTSARFTLNR